MASKNKFREIVVDSDGHLLMSIDGVVKGERHDVETAKRSSLNRIPVKITEPFATELHIANLDDGDAFGELAALMSVRPGRTRILKAPQEILDYISERSE